MSKFLEDIKTIDEKLNFSMDNYEVSEGPLLASFMPYYIDPKSMELMVVLKRSVHPGAFPRTGRKMGISVLDVELPTEKTLTIEEAFALLELPANIQNATPFGSIMTDPKYSTRAIEMVSVQIDPPEFIDAQRGIIKQLPNQYEIGVIPFDSLLGAIHQNFLQDMTTRLMLSELYIMAIEEAKNQEQNPDYTSGNGDGLIGAGANHPDEFYAKAEKPTDIGPRTSGVTDEVLAQNRQKDFGAIYTQ